MPLPPPSRRRRAARLATAAVSLVLGLAGLAGTVPAPASAAATPGPAWGLYSGPGAKGVAGARAFTRSTAVPVSRVLDFLPDDSWRAMTRIDWLLDPYRGSGYRLELSVPMLPRSGAASLEACAAGDYDAQWRAIATKLEDAGLTGTVVRPGWEANGTWYRWSAKGHESAYAGCFRAVVTSMRAVSRGLTFAWSVNNGANAVPGETLWPGDGYVDVVSVDAYDYDYSWYPVRAGVSLTQARDHAWHNVLASPRGLAYWARFARAHGKPLGLSEWGLAWRSDGHAGGDNPAFVERVVAFVRDPANGVGYATYFNSSDSSALGHNVSGTSTRFPAASRRLFALAAR